MQNGSVVPTHPNHAEVHPDRNHRARWLVKLRALSRAETRHRGGRSGARSSRHHAAKHVWSSSGEPAFAVIGAITCANSFEFARKVRLRWSHTLFADEILRRSKVLSRKLPGYANGQLRQGQWHSVRATALQARRLVTKPGCSHLGSSTRRSHFRFDRFAITVTGTRMPCGLRRRPLYTAGHIILLLATFPLV